MCLDLQLTLALSCAKESTLTLMLPKYFLLQTMELSPPTHTKIL